MITRDVRKDLISADWTDDCQIEIWTRKRKRVTTLTIAEAKALRSELDVAITEASRGADELRHEHEPAAVDLIGSRISPDCRAGKHPLHQDEAWDDVADAEVLCECACHDEATR